MPAARVGRRARGSVSAFRFARASGCRGRFGTGAHRPCCADSVARDNRRSGRAEAGSRPVLGRAGDRQRARAGGRLPVRCAQAAGLGEEARYDLHLQSEGRYRVYLAGEFEPGDVRVDLQADAGRLVLGGVQGEPVITLVTVAEAPDGITASVEDERLDGFGKRLLDGNTSGTTSPSPPRSPSRSRMALARRPLAAGDPARRRRRGR